MKKITLILCMQLLAFHTVLNAQKSQDDNFLRKKIDSYLSDGVSHGFSGVVLVAKKGSILLHKGYGLANKEANISYTTETVSTIGSVTKQFTATAILKLVEYNKLQVSDPISKFFSKLPEDKKDITIHQLLTHSSGLVDVISGDFEYMSTAHFFKTLFATELRHKPGAKYDYSNCGYSILARIIEIVSGQEYETFINEQLFKPAGMKNTGYFIPDWTHKTIASGYALNIFSMGTMIDRFQKKKSVSWSLKGNGGIHSTTDDMYKWYKALKANKILPKSLFEKLTTPYIAEFKDGSSHYAYGWAIYNSKKHTKIISHNGGNKIFFHEYIWLPEEDIVIILFTNASSREAEVTWPIQKMMLDKNCEPQPIKKNLYYLVYDFIKNRTVQDSSDLINIISKTYRSEIRNSDKLNDLGYRILNKELVQTETNVKWALALFKLNTKLFPNDGNIWDSLGEGYLKDGQKEKAIESYEKALQLAANNRCDWCDSSKKALQQLKKL